MLEKAPFKKWKYNPENNRIYLQIIYTWSETCAEYIKNSYKSEIKRQPNQKMNKGFEPDIFSKEDTQMSIKKNTQHHY